MKKIAVLAVLILVTIQPVLAQNRKLVKSAVADLNGDGKPEKISLVLAKYGLPYDFILKVNDISVKGKLFEGIAGFTVVDVDRGDKYKEIAVHTDGPSDDPGDAVYWYDGKQVKEVGKFDGGVEFKGNGIVLVSERLDFTAVTEKYVLGGKTRTFKHIPQEMYYLGQKIEVLESFPIQMSRSNPAVVANMAPRSKAVIVAYAPERDKARIVKNKEGYEDMDHHWYLIKTESNLLGWAKLKTFNGKVDGIYWAD